MLVDQIQEGDLVYYDPPYWGLFDMYGPEGFGDALQVALVRLCAELCERGVHVIYTNVDCPEVRKTLDELWPYSTVRFAQCRRYVNRNGDGRKVVSDLVVTGPTSKRRRRFPRNEQASLALSQQ